MKTIKRALRIETLEDRALLSASPLGEIVAPEPTHIGTDGGIFRGISGGATSSSYRGTTYIGTSALDTDGSEVQRVTVTGSGTFATGEAGDTAAWPNKIEIGSMKAGGSVAHDTHAVDAVFSAQGDAATAMKNALRKGGPNAIVTGQGDGEGEEAAARIDRLPADLAAQGDAAATTLGFRHEHTRPQPG